MLTLELSTIQYKNSERAMLASAIEDFERHGGEVTKLDTFGHVGKPANWKNDGFNITNQQKRNAERDALLLEKLRLMAAAGSGISSIVMALHSSRRVIVRLAEENGIVIRKAKLEAVIPANARAANEKKYRDLRELLAEKARPLAEQGLCMVEISRQIGTSKRTMRRIVDEFEIRMGEGK